MFLDPVKEYIYLMTFTELQLCIKDCAKIKYLPKSSQLHLEL